MKYLGILALAGMLTTSIIYAMEENPNEKILLGCVRYSVDVNFYLKEPNTYQAIPGTMTSEFIPPPALLTKEGIYVTFYPKLIKVCVVKDGNLRQRQIQVTKQKQFPRNINPFQEINVYILENHLPSSDGDALTPFLKRVEDEINNPTDMGGELVQGILRRKLNPQKTDMRDESIQPRLYWKRDYRETETGNESIPKRLCMEVNES